MERKSYKNLGRVMLFLVIALAIFKMVSSFENGSFVFNSNNLDLFTNLLYLLVFVVVIFNGFKMKERYPYFHKYLTISGVIGMLSILIFEIIPRLTHLI